jgi:hypothetical protein
LLACSEHKQYTEEELALMRSQDVKYLVHKERVEAEVSQRAG